MNFSIYLVRKSHTLWKLCVLKSVIVWLSVDVQSKITTELLDSQARRVGFVLDVSDDTGDTFAICEGIGQS